MSTLVARQTADGKKTSRSAGLHYVKDDTDGITRRTRGKGFAYFDARGRLIRNQETLRRIQALVIPPAWHDVWISPTKLGHLQAAGRDARGRKQYLYHHQWQKERQETKFHRMVEFGKALLGIRRRLGMDLRKPGLPRKKVLAAVVTLLECTHIRVGNEEYVSQNGSYGLTTLKNGHAIVRGTSVKFRFRGKSGKLHEVELKDPRLARIVKSCQEIPGQELFEYTDDDGVPRDITSTDVNEYIREISGQDFSAKDFRTWAGTVLFVDALRPAGAVQIPPRGQTAIGPSRAPSCRRTG